MEQRAGRILCGALQKKGYTLALDVTDEASMVSCVDQILKKEGRIDILVNNVFQQPAAETGGGSLGYL